MRGRLEQFLLFARSSLGFKYGIMGVAAGFAFPILATTYVVYADFSGDWGVALRLHLHHPLIWMADTAPFILGGMAAHIGVIHRRLLRALAARDDEIAEATFDYEIAAARMKPLVAAVSQSPDSIVITDMHGDIQYANPAACRTSGYTRRELIGQNPRIWKSGLHDREFYVAMFQEIRATGIWRGRLHNVAKNGNSYIEDGVITAIHEGQKIVGYVAIKHEVTNEVALERQLHQAQKLEAIGQLAAGIAHEINTPTQFINDNTVFLQRAFSRIMQVVDSAKDLASAVEAGTADASAAKNLRRTMKKARLDFMTEQVPRAVEQSLEGLERVANIVAAMKEFSHPSEGKTEPVDLAHTIEMTISVARNEWKYVADMETDFDPAMPPVPCLRDEFNQVVLNMIVNGAHAIGDVTDGGSNGKGTIRISARTVGEFAEIRIADTGGGIAKENLNKIFEPFFTTKAVGKGTGQGLAIAHDVVVEKHGGTIDVESEVGVGTCFVIRLPMAIEQHGEAGAIDGGVDEQDARDETGMGMEAVA